MRVCPKQVFILAILFVIFTPRVFFRLPVSNKWLLAVHAISFFLVSYIVFTMMKYVSRMGFENKTEGNNDYLPFNFGPNPKNSNMSNLLLVDFDSSMPTTIPPVPEEPSILDIPDIMSSFNIGLDQTSEPTHSS